MAVAPVRLLALVLVAALASCGGGGGSSPAPVTGATVQPGPVITPSAMPVTSPTPSPAPVSEADYQCPTSDTATTAVVRAPAAAGDAKHVRVLHRARNSQASATQLAVIYDGATASRSAAAVATKEKSLGASAVRTLDFSHAGLTAHVLTVPAAKASAIAAALRLQPGVKSVGLTGHRRNPASVTTPYFTNDPYFDGFTVGGTAPAAPYYEAASVPGQWDMHAIGLEHAFGYSQANNGSGVVNPAALGSSSIKLAVIDTGEDTTHPELHGKIAYQKCFVSDPSNNQSTSNFTTDPQGHGTDVTGIAGAAINNDFGFVGTGGNVSLYAYRVFPTPDDSCTSDTSSDAQCSTDTVDIASAIDDAINQGVNVISMSLGGDSCTNGQDSDPTEGAAIANAIAANVVVVAAAGNDSSSPLEAPACDPGVIAVGASALGDGQPNGTSSVGTASAPVEYVASYSDWGSPAAAPNSASAWGIVAPGGDPSSDTDGDDLHWIEHIWTSQPFDSSFAGECTDDYPNSSGTTAPVDCRTQIAGTSMATPHVAGAVALILAVNSSYQSASAMKTLLCTTADDIADPHEGCGRLNVYRAMAKAVGDPNPPT